LRPCSNARFVKQLLQSCFYGGFGHADLAADLLVRKSVKQTPEHGLLPFGQASQALILALGVTIGYELNHFLIHRYFSAGDEANGLHKASRRVGFQENAGGAELQRGGRAGRIDFARDQEKFALVPGVPGSGYKLIAVFVSNAEFQQNEIYSRMVQELQCLGASGALAYDLKIRFRRQQVTEAFPKEPVVIKQRQACSSPI
jgi:hypothetical protein